MKTEPVTAARAVLVDDLEGLPGSSDGCDWVFLCAGDVWWVEDEVLYVERGDATTVAHRGYLVRAGDRVGRDRAQFDQDGVGGGSARVRWQRVAHDTVRRLAAGHRPWSTSLIKAGAGAGQW
ncbi:hypothetical protein O7631_21680 [Micromonospora sp. WMMD967]|uniref:hypothetical protein n=1 Tax=Micromonospora sp. WMMD967 TaxID=3016101 RepID=UPI00241739F6|nr:hypothetical protein [Micromonospora sp. WMMD967]MDG4839138.1 hypothetical protein [Micromonospora sp. WMMD967]